MSGTLLGEILPSFENWRLAQIRADDLALIGVDLTKDEVRDFALWLDTLDEAEAL